MNKNKIIFAIIGIIVLGLIIFGVLSLKSSSELNTGNTTKIPFNIWIVGDDKTVFEEFIKDFKIANPNYKNSNIVVESFADYEEYYLALGVSLAKGKTPDIFILNNSEKNSIYSDIVMGLDQTIINPNDFRKNYKGVFSDDLILTYDLKGEQKEIVTGIPVGYETLGIYYNARYVKDADLKSLSSLNSLISTLKEKNSDIIPLGMGNGTTVHDSADIITQFFMFDNGISGLSTLEGDKIKQAFTTYFLYGNEQSENAYNSKFNELKASSKDNLSLFSKGEIYMLAGYQSLINKIDENGYSSSLLRASPFPHYFSSEGKTLLNYNYFVLNKNITNKQLGYDFLSYLNSDTGAESYLKRFPYFLPALLSLESDKLEEKIHPKYKIALKDFLNNDSILSSFDKGMKTLYDKNIVSILDDSTNYENQFKNFKSNILCKTKKFTGFTDLSKNCEE